MYNKIYKNVQVTMKDAFVIKNQSLTPVMERNNEEKDETSNFSNTNESVDEIIERARQETELIIAEAELEAQRILEKAQTEALASAEMIVREAYQQGYDEGLADITRQYEETMQTAEAIRDQAMKEYQTILEGIETDMCELVLGIARKVIGAEMMINQDDILYLIRQGIEKCSNRENIVLKVSPVDYHYVKENEERLLSILSGVNEIIIRQDSSLKSGGCIVETPYGSVEASRETKQKNIEEAFRSLIGQL